MIYKGFVVGTGKNTFTAATVTFANPNAYYDPSVDTSPSTENDSIFLMGMNTVYSATASFTTTASVGNGDIFTSATAFTAQGQFNLIYGTMANQVLYGGAGNETINGGGGSDSMDGGAGGINLVSFGTIGTGTNNAQIDPYGIGVYVNLLTGVYNYGTTHYSNGTCEYTSGAGTVVHFTQVWGGDGNDTIVGDNNNDTLWGNAGANSIHGGNGNDLIFGAGNNAATTDGNDTIVGGAGNNTIFGGLGNNIIVSGGGANLIYGAYAEESTVRADGNDSITVGNGNDTIFGGGGRNTITGGGGNNLIYGNYASLALQDGSQDGANLITVGNGNNTISGGGYNDTITAGNGENLIFGGFGTTVAGAVAGEYFLTPGGGNDIITVGSGENTIYGGIGSDTITVNSGSSPVPASDNDLIYGDNYYLLGNEVSPNTLSGAVGNNLIFGGVGNDTIYGGGGNDTIDGGAGDNVLVGGGGNDVIYSGGGTAYSVAGSLQNALSGAYADRVYGGGGATGYSLANPDSLSGSDTIYAGYDRGSSGQLVAANTNSYAGDTLDWGSVILEDFNPNVDSLTVAPNTVAVIGGAGSYTVMNWGGADSLDMSGSNVVNNGVIVMRTGAGNDTIDAASGVNRIYAGTGNNVVNLGSGSHSDNIYIDGYGETVTVTGFGANDKLYIAESLVNGLGGVVKLDPTNSNATTGYTTSSTNFQTNANLSATATALQSQYQGSWGAPIFSPLDTYLLSQYPQYNGGTQDDIFQYDGAYTNNSLSVTAATASIAVDVAGAVMDALGIGFEFIPIVGEALAIPLITAGSGLIADSVLEARDPHQNAVIAGAALLGYANAVPDTAGGQTLVQNTGAWTPVNFTSLFGSTTDGFTPAVEVTSQPLTENSIGGTSFQDPTGINTIVALTDANQTFVYLVHSASNLITNNNATLIAEIAGQMTASQIASQIVTYNSATDPFSATSTPPDVPPNVTNVAISGVTTDSNGTNLTTSTSPTITITFATSPRALDSSDTVTVTEGSQTWTWTGSALMSALTNGGTTLSFTDSTVATRDGWSGLANPTATYSVSVASSQGFSDQLQSYTLTYDNTAPTVQNVSVAGDVLNVTTNRPATLGLLVNGSLLAGVTGTTASSGGNPAYAPVGTLNLTSYVNSTSATIQGLLAATDQLGLMSSSTTVGGTTSETEVFLGKSTGGNTITAVSGNSSTAINNIIIGTAGSGTGADTLTAGNGNDTLYGGVGNDVLNGGGGADVLVGGAGADTINLLATTHASDTMMFMALSDSTYSAYDVISNFDAGATDTLDLLPALQAANVAYVAGTLGINTSLTATGTLAADSLGWYQVTAGATTNTYVVVNATANAITNVGSNLSSTSMVIDLHGAVSLSASNFTV